MWEKSWHTPRFWENVSAAVVATSVAPGEYSICPHSACESVFAFASGLAFGMTRSTSRTKASISGVSTVIAEGRL